ncbi:hypothetical protein [Kribbella sp. NPDC051770]|uniref:hypothetical protein n=1 Tax=Kribbella sp. NPDC051770 TaxID=3155413 RepID=UPI00344A0419
MTSVEQRWVRVWFGNHVIADYRAEATLAERYAKAMERRFAGLQVTNEAVPGDGAPVRPLPNERLWEIGPQ